MAHFAKLDEHNKVVSVEVVNNDVITVNGSESEEAGIEFLTNLYGHSNWKQTSYSGNIRKNFAGIGSTYDSTLDAFIVPRPFSSWTLNEETCKWESPIPYPTDGKVYDWFEQNQEWVEVSRPM